MDNNFRNKHSKIIKDISKYLDIRTIINFTNIDSDTIKITDKILQLPIFTDLQTLHASYNPNITDQGIKNLKLVQLE